MILQPASSRRRSPGNIDIVFDWKWHTAEWAFRRIALIQRGQLIFKLNFGCQTDPSRIARLDIRLPKSLPATAQTIRHGDAAIHYGFTCAATVYTFIYLRGT